MKTPEGGCHSHKRRASFRLSSVFYLLVFRADTVSTHTGAKGLRFWLGLCSHLLDDLWTAEAQIFTLREVGTNLDLLSRNCHAGYLYLPSAEILTNERGKELWSRASCSHERGPGHILAQLQVLKKENNKAQSHRLIIRLTYEDWIGLPDNVSSPQIFSQERGQSSHHRQWPGRRTCK